MAFHILEFAQFIFIRLFYETFSFSRKKYEKCQDSRQQKWKENREMLEKKNDELENLKRSLNLALDKKQQADENHKLTMIENKKMVQELKTIIGKTDSDIFLFLVIFKCISFPQLL